MGATPLVKLDNPPSFQKDLNPKIGIVEVE